jgi:small conductance mechanosensitive channel
MLKSRFGAWLLIGMITFCGLKVLPVNAQLPALPQINWQTWKLKDNPDDRIISACVRLDGRCIFKLFDRQSQINDRVESTEESLEDISQTYFQNKNLELEVFDRSQGSLRTVSVAVGERQVPVITLNSEDASLQGTNLDHQTKQIVDRLKFAIIRAKQERQPKFLLDRAQIAAGIFVVMLLSGAIVFRQIQHYQKLKDEFNRDKKIDSTIVASQHKHKFNLQEVTYRFLQLLQIVLWLGGSLLILSLFPYTRPLQFWLLNLLEVPLRLISVIWLTYILIRLSYAAIARINALVSNNIIGGNYVFRPEINRRLQIRINTIASLIKNILTILLIGVGSFVALAIVGLDITPFLAGAGILGLALSFASQNLIKDALNGFFIILEDQYAVGDVITIGEVGGLVENLNLRITQLRDSEGRLITIPNSQINIVANHSNGWSRSDLRILVAYQTNVDRAIHIVGQVANDMSRDKLWQDLILESPEILGVEEFVDRGVVIRLWFKTEPLKQWEISREFRRRIKIAFELENIPPPLPQQQVWIQSSNYQDQKSQISAK